MECDDKEGDVKVGISKEHVMNSSVQQNDDHTVAFYRTEDGTPFAKLMCKRRNIVWQGKEYMTCPGTLLSIGHESIPMKTVQLAMQRALQVNARTHRPLSHGCRLCCDCCGDKPPSKLSSVKPTKLRSWQEWCTICREVWCNQSFHVKHGGIAKKGGEKAFKGRVKDHKKRLWCIHVALWLLKKSRSRRYRLTWICSAGLQALLPPKVTNEERSRIEQYVMRELITFDRYSSVHVTPSWKSKEISAQTWPPAKKAKALMPASYDVHTTTTTTTTTTAPTAATMCSKHESTNALKSKAIPTTVDEFVNIRIPVGLSYERSWLRQAAKLSLVAERPFTMREALKSMVQETDSASFVFPSTASMMKEATMNSKVNVATTWSDSHIRTPYRMGAGGTYPSARNRTPYVPMAVAPTYAPIHRATVAPFPSHAAAIAWYRRSKEIATNDPGRVGPIPTFVMQPSFVSPPKAMPSATQTWPPRKRGRPKSPVTGKASASLPSYGGGGMQEAAKALMMMGIKGP